MIRPRPGADETGRISVLSVQQRRTPLENFTASSVNCCFKNEKGGGNPPPF